ncbi:MAG: AAA family ATPase, partial [Ilumatobacteraceae bacterium]
MRRAGLGVCAVMEARAAIVGRENELAVIDAFVTGGERPSSSLLLDGLAGMGKTLLWTYGLSEASRQGVAVRSSRCTVADSAWAFAGLGDLLDDVPVDVLDELPDVQRRALATALLLEAPSAMTPSDRVVGVAVLGVLRQISLAAPLMLAIDDVQWLDDASRSVLTFALHRMSDERVRLLATQRCEVAPGHESASSCLGMAGTRLAVGPVTVGALRQIVGAKLSMTISRPTLTRLHDATGGNPMISLEMARALQRSGSEPSPDEPLPVPSDLRSLVTERLKGLSEAARDVLLLASALAHPTVRTVAGAFGDPSSAVACIDELTRAGAIEVDDERLRFSHPLLSSVPYEGLSGERRRALHRRLAGSVTDPEEHARHVALGTDGPDEVVAAALDLAALRARARGSTTSAAELAALAVGRTPAGHPVQLLRRRIAAAGYAFHSGDPASARAMLLAGCDDVPPGADRVDALLLLAMMEYWTEGSPAAARRCEQALHEAGDDRALLARCHAAVADLAPFDAPRLLAHARRAVELIGDADQPADVLANALKNVAYHELRLGQGLSLTVLERALGVEGRGQPLPVLERVGMYMGMLLRFAGDFQAARTWLLTMLRCARDEGDDSALPTILGHLALLECWAGEYACATGYVEQGNAMAAVTGVGSPSVTAANALVETLIGDIDKGRRVAEAAVADDEAQNDIGDVACDLRSLGFTELAAGNLAKAAEHLLRALSIADELGVQEPSILRIHADAVEALVGLGRVEEAERLTADLERGDRVQSPWAQAMAHRCRGLLAAAAGDLTGAAEDLAAAVGEHAAVMMPFEEARTRLWLGAVLRRSGHLRDARLALDSALQIFEHLGTPMFADRTRSELGRIGGRAASQLALTTTEARVADLVAAGMTNMEVAAAMFVNVRTVESHLSRVY